MTKTIPIQPYDKPAGGMGSLRGTAKAVLGNGPALATLPRLNQPRGVDCPGCAYPDSPDSKSVDFCEQGAWAIAHESGKARATPEFFATHTVTALRQWEHVQLEAAGRLTAPMLYDAASDTYREIGWDAALALAGSELRALDDPDRAVFYTSGRSSNEAAFAYQLFARAFGTNNLPDSSNLCHESSGQALTVSLGVGKSTVTRADFARAQLIMSFGHNPGSNHPRMLGDLREAKARGCRIVIFNPLRERGLETFADPQSAAGLMGSGTSLADAYYQVRVGGDLAAITGIAKAVLERGGTDDAFIAAHTEGFDAFRDLVAAQPWTDIEAASGLTRAQLEEAAGYYMASDATIAAWCMGLTQNEYAIETIQTLVDLMLLKGNVGKPGAGLMPVRGHSNVQGDRTVGITSRPKPEWLDGLRRVFAIDPPAGPGRDAIATIHGLLDGSVHAFVALGGNFAVASPDTPRVLDALSRTRLTVHVATKLNRTHLYPGRTGLLLPCLGRTELDVQAAGPQFVSVEDTASMVHASMGRNRPASDLLRSEPWIVTRLARATLPDSAIEWETIGTDYDVARDLISRVAEGAVDGFEDYNAAIRQDKGFHLPNSAGRREWRTATGRARFIGHALPRDTIMDRARAAYGDRVLCLATIRAHRQYNTTIYRDPKGEVDRYRGVHGTRHLLFVGRATLTRLGFADGDVVRVRAATPDGIERYVDGIRLVATDQATDDVFGYFPELTPLLSPVLVARGSNTPAFKQIPVLLERAGTVCPQTA